MDSTDFTDGKQRSVESVQSVVESRRRGWVNGWDRCPGEPVRWYARFESFRLLGPGRTLDAAYRLQTGRDTSHRAGASWWNHYRRWEWQQRAEAWDAAELARLRVEEEERRRAAREERLRLLGEARKQVWDGILAADLSKLNQMEPVLGEDGEPVLGEDGEPVLDVKSENVALARSMLGTLRIFFFETLKGERLEMGEPTEIVGDVDVVRFRADELAAAETELREWRKDRAGNG